MNETQATPFERLDTIAARLDLPRPQGHELVHEYVCRLLTAVLERLEPRLEPE